MESTFRHRDNHAFVLTEADIRKIWSKLESFGKSVSATVEFSDSIERKVESVEALVQFENSKKRQIKRIELIAKCEKGKNITRLELEDDDFRTVSISSSGEDGLVTQVGDQIPEIIEGLKPWYSPISKVDVVFFVGALLTICGLLVSLMTPESDGKRAAMSFEESLKAIGILIAFFSSVYLAFKCLNKLKTAIFPKASFALGQGNERYELQEKIRWGVVVALLVSFSSSLVYGFIA
ncbi:hypothetical protein F2K80_001341 [Vibrio fluvialis]|uniref:hypothetical protein n=1 Tax=Vibrio fluvialis TaxID=676 RepID=UPI001302967C|nr:hypothetical protein [Vibrio fluvialis]EKO3946772.1 hypothetical protein [Vibrio fluvialis]